MAAPRPRPITEAIYAKTKEIDSYRILDAPDIDLGRLGVTELGDTQGRGRSIRSPTIWS